MADITAPRCRRCGIEPTPDRPFQPHRLPFARTEALCSYCAKQREEPVHRWLWVAGVMAYGAFLAAAVSGSRDPAICMSSNVGVLLALQYVLILPHELAHALMARLLGLRVFQFIIGRGRTLVQFRCGHVVCIWKVLPVSGVTVFGHPGARLLRVKSLLTIAAGPLVHVVLIVILWRAIDSLHPTERIEWTAMLAGANLLLLTASLWPHRVRTALGLLPSDGLNLIRIYTMTETGVRETLVARFLLEGSECLEARRLGDALRWYEQGLEKFPDSQALCHDLAVARLESGDVGRARETFASLAGRAETGPALRTFALNNLAWADLVLGGEERLREADRASAEAIAASPESITLRGTRGAVLVELGRLEEGERLLADVVAHNPSASGRAVGACFLALARWKRGLLPEARRYLAQAEALDPQSLVLGRMRERLSASS